jgi:hypothetical protein
MTTINPSLILLDLRNAYSRFETIFDRQLFSRFTNKAQCLQHVSSRANVRLLNYFIPTSEHGDIGAGIVFLNTICYIYCTDQDSMKQMRALYDMPMIVKIISAESLLTFIRQAALVHYTEQAERRKHEPDEHNDALQAAVEQTLALANELREHMMDQIGVQPDD